MPLGSLSAEVTASAGLALAPDDVIAAFRTFMPLALRMPNQLSPGHVDWPIIDQVAAATRKPLTRQIYGAQTPIGNPLEVGSAPISFSKMVHQRRCCLALDGHTGIPRTAFYQILQKTIPGPGQFPFNALPWAPAIHCGLFIHRVQGC